MRKMKILRNFVFVGFLCFVLFDDIQAACKQGWEEFDGNCYFISGNTETWYNAVDLCTREGGHLVRITSDSENEYLKMRARCKSADFWIDGTDEDHEGTWVYGSTQAPIGFTDWNPGQPNNYQESQHCLGLYKQFDYKWDDYACGSRRFFICKMKSHTEETSGCTCNCYSCQREHISHQRKNVSNVV